VFQSQHTFLYFPEYTKIEPNKNESVLANGEYIFPNLIFYEFARTIVFNVYLLQIQILKLRRGSDRSWETFYEEIHNFYS
jgi:hypothetical protein